MDLKQIPEPLNAQERLLYHMVIRQNVLIEQLNSIIEHISKKDEVAVEETKVEEKVEAPKRRTRKKVE